MHIAQVLIEIFMVALNYAQTGSTPSPGEIVNRINGKVDIHIIWRELGIDSELFNNSGGPYHVKRFVVKPDKRIGSYVILRISDELAWDWQYLIFTKKGTAWKFLGNVDLPRQKYEDPQHQIVAKGKKGIWLIVRSLESSGTGVLLYEDIWYDVGGNKPTEVLRYPVRGRVMGWNLAFDREFTAKVLTKGQRNGVYIVEILFTVSYSNGFLEEEEIKDLKELFTTRRKARYVWNLTKNEFVLDSSNSELSEEEIDGIFNDAHDEFLIHNFKELMKLATYGSDLQKEWLKRFLDKCRDSSQKQALYEKIR